MDEKEDMIVELKTETIQTDIKKKAVININNFSIMNNIQFSTFAHKIYFNFFGILLIYQRNT